MPKRKLTIDVLIDKLNKAKLNKEKADLALEEAQYNLDQIQADMGYFTFSNIFNKSSDRRRKVCHNKFAKFMSKGTKTQKEASIEFGISLGWVSQLCSKYNIPFKRG